MTIKRKEDKVEERTQIKFDNPDIDGTPSEKVIILEEEEPIEGQSERENGDPFTWHRWICTNNEYFMASDTLDIMLKSIPNKVGKPTKIQKVLNPKGGGFPYFMVNGMTKDDMAKNQILGKQIQKSPPVTDDKDTTYGAMPPKPTQTTTANTDNSIAKLEKMLSQSIELQKQILEYVKPVIKEEELPF